MNKGRVSNSKITIGESEKEKWNFKTSNKGTLIVVNPYLSPGYHWGIGVIC